MFRICADCGRDLPRSSYTTNQWTQGNGVSRCASCVHGHASDIPRETQVNSGRINQSSHAWIPNHSLRHPFAEGGFRWVAKGEYFDGPRAGQVAVAKWFKTGAVFSNDYFTLDIKAVDRALELVNRFNDLGIVDKRIKINVPQVWRFEDTGNGNSWDGMKSLVEPFIENYQKFNSNTGWFDDSTPWQQVMQALSHFSYHITRGNFVLCDLQGGIYAHEVVLSDPVILSRNLEYGVTDLGPEGISSFFAHHECNQYCRPHWERPANPFPYYRPKKGSSLLRRDVPTRTSRPYGTSTLAPLSE